MESRKILFIGGGNMGSAIIARMVAADYPGLMISVSDKHPEKLEILQSKYGIQPSSLSAEDLKKQEVVVLAVKPQQLPSLLEEISDKLSDKLIISIAAGVQVEALRTMIGHDRIVRVMPNTPVSIKAGVCGLYFSKGAESDKSYVQGLFSSCGEVVVCDREDMIEAVTAVSGSGPAYVFHFIEALEVAAVRYGFSPEVARKMAVMTVFGAGSLALHSADSPAELRKKVTSKGGTTFEALKVMDESGFVDMMQRAMDACKNRAEELGKEFAEGINRK